MEAADCSRDVHYAPRSMSLDVLAPDQRAVVQLVLQQDRSYEELAGLLGIAPEAVRDRARRVLRRHVPPRQPRPPSPDRHHSEVEGSAGQVREPLHVRVQPGVAGDPDPAGGVQP